MKKYYFEIAKFFLILISVSLITLIVMINNPQYNLPAYAFALSIYISPIIFLIPIYTKKINLNFIKFFLPFIIYLILLLISNTKVYNFETTLVFKIFYFIIWIMIALFIWARNKSQLNSLSSSNSGKG